MGMKALTGRVRAVLRLAMPENRRPRFYAANTAVRLRCLELAIGEGGGDVLSTAALYLDFVQGRSRG